MKKNMIAKVFLILILTYFGANSHADILQGYFSNSKDRVIDGVQLADVSHIDKSFEKNKHDKNRHDKNRHKKHKRKKNKRPNILLIIADDVGMDMVTGNDSTPGVYPGLIDDLLVKYSDLDTEKLERINGKPASTPVLDSLARNGMRFTNAWAEPFCSPTRATIITGMFMRKHNVTTFDVPMTTAHLTFVERLRDEANYSTAAFGKWHLAGGQTTGYNRAMPQMQGFEVFRGNLDSAPTPGYWDHYYHVQDENTPDPGVIASLNDPPPERSLPGIAPTTFAPVVRAADTIQWITEKEAENPKKPWFAWLAFNEAHVTLDYPYYHVPNEDTLDQATRDEIRSCLGDSEWPAWSSEDPERPYFDGSGDGVTECNSAQLMRAMTNAMDTVIGKVLDAVEELDPNTYVIFIGDNGTWSQNMDNMYGTFSGRGKTTPYESGARVPLVIRGPGITADSQSNEFVHAADLYSTFLELAGLEVESDKITYTDFNGDPADLDGISLKPILFDDISSIRDEDFDFLLEEVGWLGNKAGARNGTYKVIRFQYQNNLFYNIADDQLEEYPLTLPESCDDYEGGIWQPETDEGWHYCYLLDMIDNFSIFNSIPADTTGPSVTVDKAPGQSDPTRNPIIKFTVVFSEPVNDFTSDDVTISGEAGADIARVTEICPNDGTTYRVTVSGIKGQGSVIVDIEAGVAHDIVGNDNEASTAIDNKVTYITHDPIIIIDDTPLSEFSSQPGIPSEAQSYLVSGVNLEEDISITAPSDFEISDNSSGPFSQSLTLHESRGRVPETEIFVRFNRDTEGLSDGTITHESFNAITRDVSVSGKAIIIYLDGDVSVDMDNEVSSIEVSHTTGTGEDRLMLVGVTWNCNATNRTIYSATFTPDEGSAIDLTEVITEQTSNTAQPRYSAIYSLIDPPAGVTGTVTISFVDDDGADAAVPGGIVVGAVNFAGVDQITPIGLSNGANGVSTDPSVELDLSDPVFADHEYYVFDNLFMGAAVTTQIMTAGSGQTPLWSEIISSTRATGSIKQVTGGSLTNISWTAEASRYWAIVAVAINPALPE